MRYFIANLYILRVSAAVLFDGFCFVAAASVTWLVLHPATVPENYAFGVAVGAVAAFLLLYFADAYRLTRMGKPGETARALLTAGGLAFAACPIIYYGLRVPEGAKASAVMTGAIYMPLLLAERLAFQRVSARWSARVAIVGTDHLALMLAEAIVQRNNLGLEFVGFIAESRGARDIGAGSPILGTVDEFAKVVERMNIGLLAIAVPNPDASLPCEELLRAKLKGLRIESGLSLYERITGRVYLRSVHPTYLLFSSGFFSTAMSDALKRMMDVVASSIGLMLCAPILGLAAIAIRLDSRGPVLYWQERVGYDGRIFCVAKLRSMVNDAEAKTGAVFCNVDGDSRITRVGRWLRPTRLDEVPQLWNVLKGEMSLVGPRPERPKFVEDFGRKYPYFLLRSTVKPGLTGWAQVRHGYVSDDEGAEEKLALDMFYIKYRSFVLDVLILVKTLRTVLLLQGA